MTRARRRAAIEAAGRDTDASLARARADHAREREAASRDARLAASLHDIRAENHFTGIIATAFRGE